MVSLILLGTNEDIGVNQKLSYLSPLSRFRSFRDFDDCMDPIFPILLETLSQSFNKFLLYAALLDNFLQKLFSKTLKLK